MSGEEGRSKAKELEQDTGRRQQGTDRGAIAMAGPESKHPRERMIPLWRSALGTLLHAIGEGVKAARRTQEKKGHE